MSFRLLAIATFTLALSVSTFAQKPITYVDADSLGPILNPGDSTDRSTGNTAQLFNVGFDDWVVRDNGVGGDVYQFMPSNGTDPTELVTTISGLTPGKEYNFFTFFWEASNGTANWFVDTSLSGPNALDTEFTNYNNALLDNISGPVYEAAALPFANLGDINGTNEFVQSAPGEFYTNQLTPGFGNDQVRTNAAASDLDLLGASIGSMTAPASGQVSIYVRNLTGANRVWYDGVGYQEAGGVLGDANGDGDVDIDDYNEIASRIGGPAVTPGSTGDVFGDGIIDLRDFSVWQQNRTDLGSSSTTNAIPEPASLAMVCLAATTLVARRVIKG